ncbi:hypothetical protein DKT68_15180 [Micromonospora acroterricola]|uniref:Uncharacterized protein n=1 Tax=Micromonospora acroterricola TaxID=2202421 RepID=A0A317D1X5_9ACTN|nr:hypothetical protein [Micromonospora acroterricola]PWR08557.1 hypothetical protein DKT68_15180 [Micromonospora acroterricola]
MEIVLLWCFVIAWMGKRGAEDLVHAVKGTPNPRYELKKQRAKAAGHRPAQQPRYGGREWFADLYSDALAAHTEKRRKSAAARARPVDDMVGIVREPKPQPERGEPEWLTPDPDELSGSSVVHDDQHPYCLEPCGPACGREAWRCGRCGAGEFGFMTRARAQESASNHRCLADETLAQVIQFPNIKKIEKEITMPNSEATGLTTAIAFADAAATAHQEFSTAGSEGYAGSLEQMGFGPSITGLAAEAREASGTATEKWNALSNAMKDFMQGREFYANNPDAPEKVALVNE